MSYSSQRREALNPEGILPHRLSHVRSLAMLMGQKYRVHRDVIMAHVLRVSGVDLTKACTEADLMTAIQVLDQIKTDGLSAMNRPAHRTGGNG